MGEDPIWRLMGRFSTPAIISMTVSSTYNLVDAAFVGRLGATALAAMAVTYPLVLSFVAVASGTAMGATSLIARSLGARDDESAVRTAGVAVVLGFIVSALIAAICLPMLDTLLHVLGAGGAVLPLARSYISVLIMCNIFAYLSLVLASTVRADGNPLFASAVSISAGLLNVALDPVFIFGIGPVPTLGIQGAAIATVISQAAATGALVFWMIRGKTGFAFRPSHFIPRLSVILGIYRVGAASLVRSGAQFVVMAVINSTAASFGVVPLAIIGVLARAGRFNQMPILGLGQGITPVISYNYGAGKTTRVAEVMRKMAASGSLWTTACWLAIMLFPTQIMSFFSGDSAFLEEGATAIRLFSLLWFALGLQLTPTFFFQGIGKGLPATVLTGAQNLVFLMLPVLILPRVFGITGLWAAFPVGDLLALGAGVVWMGLEFRSQGIRLLRRTPTKTVSLPE